MGAYSSGNAQAGPRAAFARSARARDYTPRVLGRTEALRIPGVTRMQTYHTAASAPVLRHSLSDVHSALAAARHMAIAKAHNINLAMLKSLADLPNPVGFTARPSC